MTGSRNLRIARWTAQELALPVREAHQAIVAARRAGLHPRRAIRALQVVHLPKVRRCRKCGCTDRQGCPEGCWWVAADLCSSCRD